jgi:multisubunit Na+/H+ antiporter MnhG subunit
VGDIEGGIALLKLARLYERTNEADQAAAAYTQYIQVGGWVGDIEGGIALLKLASLYERTNEVDQAATAYTQYIQVGWWVILREVLPC